MIGTYLKTTGIAVLISLMAVQQDDCGGGDDDSPTPSPDYDFWSGETGPEGPLWSGPQQYPFICYTYESNLGQPLIDNQDGVGSAVFPEVDGVPDYEADPIGWSALCGIETRLDYFYLATDGSFRLYDSANPPSDLDTIEIDGQIYPFLVRVESGTLNRFLYAIAILAPFPEELSSPDTLNNDAWNGKLVYYLRGGVGIGHWQGEAGWHGGVWSAEKPVFKALFEQGYAIAMSSGNETGVHYNMVLADETAWMVKQHFIASYGEPEYTVGVGGSGGGVQQYMFAQNRPGLLDAGIPLYSYPDMITQSIYVGDCNLLEQYFMEDVAAKGDQSKWATWSNRQWVEGMNASDTVENSIWGTPGSTECIEAWWFAEPVVLNPVFTIPDYITMLHLYGYPQADISAVKWTHFNDLENVYGTDARGFAPSTFDNEGVQYGLGALQRGQLTVPEFLEINSCVGTWTEQEDYVMWDPENDPFDAKNMLRDAEACRNGTPAPRRIGEIDGMHSAYESGHVFHGEADIPLIDLRPYLEEELDMHNTRQSFAARQRMLNYDGDASNQVIWFAATEDDLIQNRVMDAFDLIDRYMTTGQAPEDFVDQCFDADGNQIAAGNQVWDGILNDNPEGPCTQAFPTYTSARMEAGDGPAGDMFKCGLKTLDEALSDGTYEGISFTADQEAFLRLIFPTGVCDYAQRDLGKPVGF